jgi:pimeloyl-ACP methyl ester carboxylesterase
MYSPAGFDATVEKWTAQGIYAKARILDHLSRHYSCIIFDRRECGQSGGRVEAVTWQQYADQGKGLLDHLNIRRAHLMGGCMGCCPVLSFAVAHQSAVLSMILYWPVGGPKYRIRSRQRFADHLQFVQQRGLREVVSLVKKEGKTFASEPKGGPWASVIKNNAEFAEEFERQDPNEYSRIVSAMSVGLFNCDAVPGPEPTDLFQLDIPALIVPGHDESHATSAARYLEECLTNAQYWDAAVADQTEDTVSHRLLAFADTR